MATARQGRGAHGPTGASNHGGEGSCLGRCLVVGHVSRVVGFLTKRHHSPREACTELAMRQLKPSGLIKVYERLKDVDLPEAKALSKVALIPRGSVPDVSHTHNPLAKLVQNIDHVHPLTVQGVHHGLLGSNAAVLNTAFGLVDLPGLQMLSPRQHE
eukprot:2287835-Prymnesium_polylepis.2